MREVGCIMFDSICKLYVIYDIWPYAHQKVSTVATARQFLIKKKYNFVLLQSRKRMELFLCCGVKRG